MRLTRFVLLLAAPAAFAQPLPPNVEVSAEGKIHADVRAFPEGPEGENPGFLLRRARVGLTVEVDGRYRAVLEPGFGEGEVELLDGYVEADLGAVGPGALAARVGRFKTPVGYESLQSSSDLRFAERGLPTALSPRRDLGAMLTWDADRATVQAGVFNGVPDGASRSDDWGSGPDGAARVFVRPGGLAEGLGIGLAVAVGTEEDSDGSSLAEYETSGDRTFFDYAYGVRADGLRVRWAPQATLDVGRLHLLGEWTLARHHVARETESTALSHQAWQAAASVVVLGRPQGADRPVPQRSVADGGPGAVEVSARVHGLTLDADARPLAEVGSARSATAVGVAVHWSPVALARLGVTVERTVFDGFAGGDGPPAETLVVVRAQIDL